MQPTPNQVHVNAILTNISVAYIQSADSFVAGKVFPVVPVEKQRTCTSRTPRTTGSRRSPAARARHRERRQRLRPVDRAVYLRRVRLPQGRGQPDAGQQRSAAQSEDGRDPLRDPAPAAAPGDPVGRRLLHHLVWGTDSTPSNLWSDYTNSDPVGDVETGRRTILANTGFKPNKLTVGYDVWASSRTTPTSSTASSTRRGRATRRSPRGRPSRRCSSSTSCWCARRSRRPTSRTRRPPIVRAGQARPADLQPAGAGAADAERGLYVHVARRVGRPGHDGRRQRDPDALAGQRPL
jgi:hypothetical protein